MTSMWPCNDQLKGGYRVFCGGDIAFFAPDGPAISLDRTLMRVTGHGVDTLESVDHVYGTRAIDSVFGARSRPHFNQAPDRDVDDKDGAWWL